MEEFGPTPVETLQKELEEHKAVQRKGDAMRKLVESDEFKEVFTQDFVENYYKTATRNAWVFGDDSSENFVYHVKARSIFVKYTEEILERGDIATELVKQCEVAIIDEQKLALEPEQEPEDEVS